MIGEDNRRRNYLIVTRLLALGGVVLLWMSRSMHGTEKNIVTTIALTLFIGLVIVTVWYNMKPGAFKNRSANPDEER